MKAILEFDLPDDRSEFRIASRAFDWALVLNDIVDGTLRNWLKYGHDFKTADEALEAMRTRCYALMEAHGVSLDDIE